MKCKKLILILLIQLHLNKLWYLLFDCILVGNFILSHLLGLKSPGFIILISLLKSTENNIFFFCGLRVKRKECKLKFVRDMRDIIISSTTKRNKCVFIKRRMKALYILQMLHSFCFLDNTWYSCDIVYGKQAFFSFHECYVYMYLTPY